MGKVILRFIYSSVLAPQAMAAFSRSVLHKVLNKRNGSTISQLLNGTFIKSKIADHHQTSLFENLDSCNPSEKIY